MGILGGPPNRDLWLDPGIPGRPLQPLTPPRGAPGSTPTNRGSAQAAPSMSRFSEVIQPTNYRNVQIVNFSLVDGVPVIALLEPPDVRLFLNIRNASSSIGVVGVAYNIEPNSFEDCIHELSPGGQLLMDYFVPQNRIYVCSYGGTAKIVCGFSNWGA